MPAGAFVQENEYGAIVSVPSTVVPERNSTRASWFSGSDAFAARLMVAGAVNCAPLVGEVRLTVGT